jgi:hypothetical protein
MSPQSDDPVFPHPDDPTSWPVFRPLIIAHDVGHTRDHSTAVIGGLSPFQPPLIGVVQALELPPKLHGIARASALGHIDRHYQCNGLIVADLSYDPSYAETLYQTFGRRVIGLHIARYGDGQQAELRSVHNGAIPVYTIGRSYLLELLEAQFQAHQVRLSHGADVRRAYEQLAKLQLEHRQSGTVYTCPPGHHDDLAISVAMLVWAARHPHLPYWVRALERRPRRPREKVSWLAWT